MDSELNRNSTSWLGARGAVRRCLLAGILSPVLVGCGTGPQAESPFAQQPAAVEGHVDEIALTTIRLTPEAEERVGIETALVVLDAVDRQRTLGGEVVVPPGATIAVTAPFAGTLSLPENASVPAVGSMLRESQPLFLIRPLDRDLRGTNPVAQAEADLARAQAQIDAAEIRLTRTEQLLRDQAGSQRQVDDARAELAQAEAAAQGARAQIEYLRGIPLEAGSGLLIAAPADAQVLRVLAVAGQSVAAGSPLVEVADLSNLWLKVPVYVGEVDAIAADSSALVHGLGASAGPGAFAARPVTAPPSGNPDVATVDLYYGLPNDGGAWRPGQKVGVTLELTGAQESLRVPWSAVVQDIYGGSWVYVRTQPQTYVRTRVAVERVENDVAILDRGPEAGAEVVTAGTAELFSTEFGTGSH